MLVELPNAYGDAAHNMAIDAALLASVPEHCALFRHYGWSEPAMTFGYSQRYAEVAATAPEGTALCRRTTGGGIVDHRNDWTYALILGKKLHAAGTSSTQLYQEIHEAIAAALRLQGAATRLAPCPRKCGEVPSKPAGPDQCFVQPVMNDVLTPDGRKIAGAAMKRTKRGLLIQGSIDRAALPGNIDFDAFKKAFVAALSETLSIIQEQPEDLRPYFDSELIEQERQKFGSADWTERR